MNFLIALVPEMTLIVAACVLFVASAFQSAAIRRVAPWVALMALIATMIELVGRTGGQLNVAGVESTLTLAPFGVYIKGLTAAISVLLLLLHWPDDKDAGGNSSLKLDREGPEYFGLMLLSIAGVMLVASANDLILFFLAIELASIPTYVMLSISRPIASAQEAAVKYFFLGAFSAAITLFGLSFIFGSTGCITLTGVAQALSSGSSMTPGWLLLGTVMVVLGLAFKLAAFPLHFYAPDVYTGAATPMTALLSFIPKTAGIVGLIRILYSLSGGESVGLPMSLQTLLWVIAVGTMTIGNLLGLMQNNIKRMMACSSIAHSGYMLAGVYVIFSSRGPASELALEGVLFYLAAYGLSNAGIFAVLMMIPAKSDPFVNDGKIAPATTAETFMEIAGFGRRNVGLGIIMAICAFSLIGIPLTVGFAGKLFLIRPALLSSSIWLTIIMVLNAAISAGYYLRLVSSMFLKEPREDMASTVGLDSEACGKICMRTIPLVLAGVVSAGAVVVMGTVIPATTALRTTIMNSVDITPRSAAAKTDQSMPDSEQGIPASPARQ